ncbi:hypothetical protein TrRE_jg110 [Triparma retinervis]|uniref:V-SNARE coiled-coil homology domain-containing protein n=1 Tax=Triparma retinervis TaxID=2557542 RepID=A0A9W6ZPD5_9STRA|nr:hypothetical protein TrRE_jg110 [Triparma retinervis]
MVKIVGISILKGGALAADPIVISRADDLSSFGFFQRQLLEEYSNAVTDAVWKSCNTPESIPYPPLEEYLAKYQDPASADKITKIQKDLDDTTEILHKTIDNVLERGVKLDQLVERSDDLSRQSKMFYKQARKTNSCCTIS